MKRFTACVATLLAMVALMAFPRAALAGFANMIGVISYSENFTITVTANGANNGVLSQDFPLERSFVVLTTDEYRSANSFASLAGGYLYLADSNTPRFTAFNFIGTSFIVRGTAYKMAYRPRQVLNVTASITPNHGSEATTDSPISLLGDPIKALVLKNWIWFVGDMGVRTYVHIQSASVLRWTHIASLSGSSAHVIGTTIIEP